MAEAALAPGEALAATDREEPVDPVRELESLTQFVYQLPVGVMRCAADGTVELMNPPVARLLPGDMARWTSASVYDLLESVFPDLRTLLSAGTGGGRIVEGRRVPVAAPVPGRPLLWLSFTIIRFDDGGFAMTIADVSAEVEREQQMRQASAWVTALVQGHSEHMACCLDRDGRIVDWTASAERMTGWDAAEMLGRPVDALFAVEPSLHERVQARLRRATLAGWDFDEGMMRRADAAPWFANSLITALDDAPSGPRFALVARDMTDRREASEALRRMTVQDQLTGAYNRAYLYTVGEIELAAHRAAGRPVAAIVLDLDWFKRVNDTYGHDAGDAALVRVSLLCQRQLRATDMLARLGGEEFCAVLPGCTAAGALRIAERMRAEIAREPLMHEGRSIALSASFGVAEAGEGTDSLQSLIADADRALYRAKRDGRDRVHVAGAT